MHTFPPLGQSLARAVSRPGPSARFNAYSALASSAIEARACAVFPPGAPASHPERCKLPHAESIQVWRVLRKASR